MKLYDVPRGSRVRVRGDIATAHGSAEVKMGDELILHNIDGMYSYCTDWNNQPVHLAAWVEVEIIEL